MSLNALKEQIFVVIDETFERKKNEVNNPPLRRFHRRIPMMPSTMNTTASVAKTLATTTTPASGQFVAAADDTWATIIANIIQQLFSMFDIL